MEAMEKKSTSEVKENLFVRFLAWMQSTRIVFDLGELSMTAWNSQCWGLIALKKGKQFFLIKHRQGHRTSYHMIPRTALPRIIEKIERLKQEQVNEQTGN